VQTLLGDFGANTSSRSDFLAVHSPIQGISVENPQRDEPVDDHKLYRLLSSTEGRLAAFLKGPPGSGKSHLIRWLSVRWATEHPNDHVLFISREDGTLKATLERLVESLGEDRDLVAGLSAAGSGLTREGVELKLLQALAFWLNPNTRSDSPKEIRAAKHHELWKIFDHPAVRRALARPSGPVELIVDKLVGGKGKLAEDVPRFTHAELETLEGACTGVAGIINRLRYLLGDPTAVAVALRALNAALTAATEESVAIGPQRLPEALRQLRRRVFSRGSERRIVLMIEDVSAFTGIDRGLIEAMLSERNVAEPEMAPLLSIVGLTTQYFENEFTGQGAALQRMTHVISIGGGSSLEGDPAGFAARYLNAVRFADDRSFTGATLGEAPSACSECSARPDCHRDFGAWGDSGYGLYPFNQRMLKTAFEALRDPSAAGAAQRTPRTFKWLVAALLNEDAERSAGALGALLGRQDPSRSPELRLATERTAEALAPDAAEEMMTLARWWGDGRLDTGALPRAAYEHFGLPVPQRRAPDIATSGVADPTTEIDATKSQPTAGPAPRGESERRRGSEPDGARPVQTPQGSTLNTYREWLRLWFRQGQPLQGQNRWRAAGHKLLLVGAPWQSFGLPDGDDKLFPEAAVAVEGQMGEIQPHAFKLPRAEDVHEALAAAAEVESGRADEDGLQARAFFRFLERRGPEVVLQVRGLIPTTAGTPWNPALCALQLLLLDALLSRRAAIGDGLPRLLHSAFAPVDREADRPHKTLPTWLAVARNLQEKRDALRRLARTWLDLAPGEVPFLAIPGLIEPLKRFLTDLEPSDAPHAAKFSQMAGPRTKELAEAARLQAGVGEKLPTLRMEARAAAERLALQLRPRGFPETAGPRDLVKAAERLSQGPGIRALGAATLTHLVKQLGDAKLNLAVAQVELDSWSAERAEAAARSFADAAHEADLPRRLAALAAQAFDEATPVAALTAAAVDLIRNLDQRRRQAAADEGPSAARETLFKARTALLAVKGHVKTIEGAFQ
jgi:hypothetical protein